MKRSPAKLALRRETLRTIASLELTRVVGGDTALAYTGAAICTDALLAETGAAMCTSRAETGAAMCTSSRAAPNPTGG